MKYDMTSGSEWKLILRFSLPIMIGNLLQQLYNTVDGIVVGNFVSENALAAVGSCMTLVMVFLGIAIGMSNGSSIMIAQLFGARRKDELRVAASTAMIILIAMGAVLTVLGVIFSDFLITAVVNIKDDGLAEMAVTYLKIYCFGLVFQFAYNAIAAVLRAVGDSRATLYFLIVSAVMNVSLDLLFVIAFNWGVAGAAVATVISQAACVSVSLIYMWKKHPVFRYKLRELKYDREKARINFRLGVPTMLQQLVVSGGHVFIQRLVNGFGSSTMAAFTVGTRIDSYLFITVFGFNMGLSTFTGQNIGAGNLDRVHKGWRSTAIMSCAVTLTLSILMIIFASPVSALFGVGGEAKKQSIEFVRYIGYFFVIFAFNGANMALLQGAGDVIYAAMCTLSVFVIRVIIAYIMVYGFEGGYYWAWASIPFGWTTAVTLTFVRYKRGRWKTKAITRAAKQKEGGAEAV